MKITLFVSLLVVIAPSHAAAPQKSAEQSAKLGWYPKYQALELESRITGRYEEFILEGIGKWGCMNRVETTESQYPFLLQKYPQAHGSHLALMKHLESLYNTIEKEQENARKARAEAVALALSKQGLNPQAKVFQPGSAKH